MPCCLASSIDVRNVRLACRFLAYFLFLEILIGMRFSPSHHSHSYTLMPLISYWFARIETMVPRSCWDFRISFCVLGAAYSRVIFAPLSTMLFHKDRTSVSFFHSVHIIRTQENWSTTTSTTAVGRFKICWSSFRLVIFCDYPDAI